MHQCLHIAEIVANVCEHAGEVEDVYACHDPGWNNLSREAPCPTLLALALTSKSFFEPALDSLWKFQGSFVPILKTLPSDSWKDEGGHSPKLVSYEVVSFTITTLTSQWLLAPHSSFGAI
jgi:hypothetical protein